MLDHNQRFFCKAAVNFILKLYFEPNIFFFTEMSVKLSLYYQSGILTAAVATRRPQGGAPPTLITTILSQHDLNDPQNFTNDYSTSQY